MATQGELFCDPLPAHCYPQSAGYRDHDTSKAAAASINTDTLRGQVMQLFAHGEQLTADECAELLGESVLAIRPRVTECVRLGVLRDSGARRPNKSGRLAKVITRV